jgi:hypothetical protein
MNSANVPIEQLADRVIAHVARYRLTVREALVALPGLSDLDTWGQRKLLSELEKSGLLAAAALHLGNRYYYLTRRAAERLGLAADRHGPLSESAKLRHYALLAFCCLRDSRRERLTAIELQQHFPQLYRDGMPGTYYIELTPGVRRLGLARIDAGHVGRWDRILQTCREDFHSHQLQPGFRKLIQAGQFEITILTPFQCKAERLRDALLATPQTQRLPVQAVALPELLPLIAPQRHLARKEVASL